MLYRTKKQVLTAAKIARKRMNCCFRSFAFDLIQSALGDHAAPVVGEVAQNKHSAVMTPPHISPS